MGVTVGKSGKPKPGMREIFLRIPELCVRRSQKYIHKALIVKNLEYKFCCLGRKKERASAISKLHLAAARR
ncbi:MAG: hypothetical protein ACLFU4_03770 [Opitutales bacterium]